MDWDEIELEKTLRAVKAQPKEQRLEYYFRYAWLFCPEELELTRQEVRDYQLLKEAAVSMKPGKKRNAVIRQVVKPLLKARGFQSVKNSWWKELEDSFLFIYLKNSCWNSMATGATFSFQISVSGKEEIRGELSEQWMHNQLHDLCQNDFLPYCGYLSPRMKSREYCIDGYRNHLPLDEPLEEITEQIRTDFEDFILPGLEGIHTVEDWNILYKEKMLARDTEDVRLLRYYSLAHMFSCSEDNIRGLIQTQREWGLTAEKIISHFDWLETIQKYSDQNFRDTKSYILDALEMQKD